MENVIYDAMKYLFYAMAAATIFAPIMITFMYRLGQVSIVKKTKLKNFKGSNSLFYKVMNRDVQNGTPNMGGVMIMLITPIVTFLVVDPSPQLKVLLIGFLLIGLWGVIETVFTNAIREKEELKARQETFEWRLGKLTLVVLLNSFIYYLLHITGTFETLSITSTISIAVVPLMIPVIGFFSQLATYATDITDGLDGLLMGISVIIITGFTFLLYMQGHYDFIPFLMILLGVIAVDLYFNIPPARFWNGAPGAMPIGFAFFFIALVTGNLISYFFLTAITWGILASSAIQILSMKFLKKRVFKIAPIHHHFQAVGWPDYKVTMRFWLFTGMTVIVGVFIGMTLY